MSAKDQLKEYKTILDKELAKYFEFKLKEAAAISPEAREMMDHIADLTLRGGKRIRAALFYYSYLAHGGKDRKEAIRASMSMELSETYLLIHDDIMDNDSLRRGGITIHESYRHIADDKFHDKINPKHLGTSIGMLTGDVANSLSNEIIAESKFKDEYKLNAILLLNQIYVVECFGQAQDLFSQLKDNVTKEDILQVQRLKTVPYTFDGPIKLGALLAGAKPSQVEKLGGYSVPLGTAFQIQDDILGMFGSEEKIGKPVTSDLKEGKKTLLIINALAKANKKQKQIITTYLGNKRASLYGLKQVRKVIEDTWSLAESKRMATTLVQEAIDSVSSLKLKQEGKNFLLGIADYMVQREY